MNNKDKFKKNRKDLNNCVCDNDSYFYRSNEHFRTKLDNVEFSKDFNHIDYEGIVSEDEHYLNEESDNHIQNNYDYEQNFLENTDEYPSEDDEYSIYDYDIENNRGNEWGNKLR